MRPAFFGVAVLAVVIILAGCGGGDDSHDGPNGTDENGCKVVEVGNPPSPVKVCYPAPRG